MPYRKRTYRRRRPTRSRTGWDKASQALATASSALALAKMLKSLINVEHKFKSILGNTSVNSSGTVLSLCHTSQGDDHTARNGRSVKCASLFMRGTVTVNASANGTFVRQIIFIDKQSSGVLPTIAQLLNSTDHLAPINKNFGKRFRVIYDRTYNVNTDSRENAMFKVYRKLSHHIEYSGTTATGDGTGVNSGGVYMALISSEATNTPTVDWDTRFTFIDN